MTYGTAIELDANGDVRMSTDADGVLDVDIVSGVPEVSQAIVVWLRTRLNSDIVNPEVGLPFDVMMGVRSTSFIEGVIKEALSKIPRIESIGEMEAELDGFTRRLDVNIPVVLFGDEELTITESFGV